MSRPSYHLPSLARQRCSIGSCGLGTRKGNARGEAGPGRAHEIGTQMHANQSARVCMRGKPLHRANLMFARSPRRNRPSFAVLCMHFRGNLLLPLPGLVVASGASTAHKWSKHLWSRPTPFALSGSCTIVTAIQCLIAMPGQSLDQCNSVTLSRARRSNDRSPPAKSCLTRKVDSCRHQKRNSPQGHKPHRKAQKCGQ